MKRAKRLVPSKPSNKVRQFLYLTKEVCQVCRLRDSHETAAISSLLSIWHLLPAFVYTTSDNRFVINPMPFNSLIVNDGKQLLIVADKRGLFAFNLRHLTFKATISICLPFHLNICMTIMLYPRRQLTGRKFCNFLS